MIISNELNLGRSKMASIYETIEKSKDTGKIEKGITPYNNYKIIKGQNA